MGLRARLLTNLTKELSLAAAGAPLPRSPDIHLYAQKLIETLPDDKVERALDDLTLFVRSTRVHKELVERYNPKDDMTQTERATMSARRVGLAMPVTREDDGKDGQQS